MPSEPRAACAVDRPPAGWTVERGGGTFFDGRQTIHDVTIRLTPGGPGHRNAELTAPASDEGACD
jgi:hypothetical protein